MRFAALTACVFVAGLGVGCGLLDDRPAPVQPAAYTAAAQSQGGTIFTSARPTFGARAAD
jgi:hypothetical protein